MKPSHAFDLNASFKELDEGFCIFELIYDANGQAIDWIYTAANPAFERQTGYIDPIGKKISYFQPDLEHSWFEQFAEVAKTGKASHFTQYTAAMGIWYDVYAMPVGPAGGNQVSLLFADVTDRIQAEQALNETKERQTFLLQLSDALREIAEPGEIQKTATRLLGERLHASRVFYVVVDEDGDTADITGDYTDGVPRRVGRYSLSAFSTSALNEWRAGRTASTSDVNNDLRYNKTEREAYASVSTRAGIGIPLVKKGRLVAILGINQSVPRDWTNQEIDLAKEVAERTWDAVERAKAEEAMRQSEEKYRTLFEAMDEGVSTVQVIFDADGTVADLIYLAHNPALTRHTGITSDIIGKPVREVVPYLEPFWYEVFGRVVKTGQPERFQQEGAGVKRHFDVFLTPVAKGSSTVISVYTDITERKQAEERQSYLLRLSDALRTLTDPNKIRSVAMQVMGMHLKVSRAAYVDAEADVTAMRVISDYTDGVAPWVGMISLADFGAALGKDFLEGRTVIIDDVQTDERFADSRETYNTLEIGAAVGVPLLKNDQIVAAMGVHHKSARHWTNAEIKIIEETAERTWAAVERSKAENALQQINDRLEQQVVDRTQELKESLEFLQRSEERLRSYLTASSDLVYQMSADWREMYALDSDNFLMRTTSASDKWLKNYIPADEQSRVLTAVRKAILHKTIFELEHRVIMADGQIGWTHSRAMPLLDDKGEIKEWFGVASNITEKKKAEENLQQLKVAQQQEIVQVTLATQEEERRRIAESLHNGLGQMLYGVKISLASLSVKAAAAKPEKYEQTRQYTNDLLSEAIRDTRRISHALMPSTLDEFGLQVAVTDICNQLQSQVRFASSVHLGNIKLDRYMELALFRILQELMMNVVNHAQASLASVTISIEEQTIRLRVKDNGKGIDPQKQDKDGIGLASIRSKVKLLNGDVQIKSGLSIGTEVLVSLPMPMNNSTI